MMYLHTRQNIVIQIGCNRWTLEWWALGMTAMAKQTTSCIQKQTQHQLRHNAQAWSDILGASGGALDLSKRSCHLLNWNFSARGDPVLASTRQSLQQPIEVTEP
jgi:hypothetical protein